MSIEVLNTLAALTTVVIVAATAVAALVQLGHLRSGNQINALLTLGEKLNVRAFQDARANLRKLDAAMRDPAYRTYALAVARGLSVPDLSEEHAELRNATQLVINSYEDLGILVKHGAVQREMFLDAYSWAILKDWSTVAPFINLIREAAGTKAISENFEYMAVLAEDWMQAHPEGAYPSGVRRMQAAV
jgi:hypothetical protein